jgi:phosphatidylinositol alpha-1,6-mannosyltransferase
MATDSPIVLVTHDFPPYSGGISRYLADMCRWLPKERLTVVAPRLPGCDEFDRTAGCRVIRVTVPQGSSMPARVSEVLALHRGFKSIASRDARVLFGHFWVGLMSRLPGWDWRYALIPYGGELPRFSSGWLSRRVFAQVAEGCSAALPISLHTMAEFRQWGIPDSRIHLLRPGLDLSRLPPQPVLPWERFTGGEGPRTHCQTGAAEAKSEVRCQMSAGGGQKAGGGPVLLTVGRLDDRKGHIRVIEALARLRPRFPGLRYRVAGSGAMQQTLEHRASELGVTDAVDFLGFVPDRELDRVYESADVFVMPSLTSEQSTEGFGIVFLEASYFGLPVVGYRSGGVTDAVVDGETGVLVRPNDTGELDGALARLLEDRELRFRLGRQGRERVLRDFDWRHLAARLVEVIDGM